MKYDDELDFQFEKGTQDDDILSEIKEELEKVILENYVDNMNLLKKDLVIEIKFRSIKTSQ